MTKNVDRMMMLNRNRGYFVDVTGRGSSNYSNYVNGLGLAEMERRKIDGVSLSEIVKNQGRGSNARQSKSKREKENRDSKRGARVTRSDPK